MRTKNRVAIFILAAILIPSPAFSSPRQETLKRSRDYKNIPAKVVGTITLPRFYHEGLSLNGSDIWVCNGEKGKVWVVDTVSGRIAATIEPIADFTEAIARRPDNGLFVTDWNTEMLYEAVLDGNRLKPRSWVSLKPAHPAGVLWNGDRLFVIIWTRGMGTKFDLLELDGRMNLSARIAIKNIQEPAHLAWDGENLWITSWYHPLVYKIDIKNREIVGAFRSPVPRTTGIAWDGKYFWVTGTYGDLYKMEIAK